jgi:glutamate racemase
MSSITSAHKAPKHLKQPRPRSRKAAPVRPAEEAELDARRNSPLGVFDSGIGGLTVAAALRELMPSENIFYIGDTARVPYGGKTRQTIERYSSEITGLLLAERAKIIVVACNTASALAVPTLEQVLRVPVIGVIEPGACAAVAATCNGHVGVIGTYATIYSRAYELAIHAIDPEIRVSSQPCPMLVPLIEEGWLDDTITDQVIRRYLEKMICAGIDTLVLGCTHYPLLKEAIQRFVGPEIMLVDSAHNCAAAVKKLLAKEDLTANEEQLGKLEVALTDQSTGFLRVAERALGLQVGDVLSRTVQTAA